MSAKNRLLTVGLILPSTLFACALLVGLIGFFVVAAGFGQSTAPAPAPVSKSTKVAIPADPFAPWNGHWSGEFVSYDIDGKVRYRLRVDQRYTPAGRGQQSAVFTNTSEGGRVETVHAVNLVRDGELLCRVTKIGPDGKPVGAVIEHKGEYVGPGHIIWHRRIGEGRFEIFNEIVDGDTYWIHGTGLYGKDPHSTEIFEGRYRRIPG